MKSDFIVKICGIKNEHSAHAVLKRAPNMIGLIFVPNTSRVVDMETAKAVAELAHAQGVKVVGVFQNQPLAEVQKIAASVPLDYIQLHGNEDAEYARALMFPVIKSVSSNFSLEEARKYMESFGLSVMYFLFDREKSTPSIFVNLANVRQLSFSFPILLAGGLDVNHVAGAIYEASGNIRGVDVSRGVESAPGEKDEKLVESFIHSARDAYAKL